LALSLAVAVLLVLGLIVEFPPRNRIQGSIEKQRENYPQEGALS
jgi:hypothetical protein